MAKMRAMVVRKRGGPFEAEERDIPVPGPEEMRIRVLACGVCHSDVVTVQGLLPSVKYPRVPGHEVIGVVDAIGEGVHGWSVGARAGVGWFGGSCGYCRRCRRDAAFACENVNSQTGVTRDGGYATHMIAHVSAVAHVPDDLDPVESAPLLCAGVTTFNALRNTGAGPGDIVAVHGVGGLGHLGLQYAARQGFRTVAVNRGRDKEALARKPRRIRLYRQRRRGSGQGADCDGRRQGDPRHRHRRQGDAGDLGRARPQRRHDGDRRGRSADRQFVRSARQARVRQRLVFGHRPGFGRHAATSASATRSPR